MKRNNIQETLQNVTSDLFAANPESANVLDFSRTLKELRKTVDPNLVRQRAGRRDQNGHVHMVEYVEWHTVADILDETAPNWAHAVKDIRPIGEIVTVTVAITIDGVTREGIGTGKALTETGIKKAEHDALKRAAVKFGIARELYKKEFDSIDNEETPAPPRLDVEPRKLDIGDPVAKTLGDMVTGKQLGMIRGLARAAGVDADTESAGLMNCSVAELSKRAASEFIAHLQGLGNEAMSMRKAG